MPRRISKRSEQGAATLRCEYGDGRMISVIVPIGREAGSLEPLAHDLLSLDHCEELVLVVTAEATAEVGVDDPRVRVVRAGADGRGAALDEGGVEARGEILLFVHADTRLPRDATQHMLDALTDPQVVGGWFRRRLDDRRWSFRIVDFAANTFSRCCRIATGDQAIFCRRTAFLDSGSLQGFPLFEDMTLCRRLKKHGRLVQLPGPVLVSARRFHRRGLIRTVATNIRLTWAYFRGHDPSLLFRQYYGTGSDHTVDGQS